MTTITLPRATVEQALEALTGVVSAHSYESGTPVEAITALRAALAQQAEPVHLTGLSIRAQSTIGRWLNEDMDRAVANGANSISMPDELVEIAAWLHAQAEPGRDQRCRAEPRSDGDFVCDCKIGECPGRSAALAQQAEPVSADAAYQRWLADTHAPALRRMDSQGAFAAGWQAALAQQAEPVCKCDLRTRLVGDGCEVCNPKLAAELAQQAEPVEPVARLNKKISFDEAMRLKDQMPKGLFRRVDGQAADEIWLCAIEVAERHHNITDTHVADRLARHGIPMPEGDPK